MRSHINVGVGEDLAIGELAEIIKKVTGYLGQIVFDSSKPDGTPRKLLDITLLKDLGYSAEISLETGLRLTYEDFISKFEGKINEL